MLATRRSAIGLITGAGACCAPHFALAAKLGEAETASILNEDFACLTANVREPDDGDFPILPDEDLELFSQTIGRAEYKDPLEEFQLSRKSDPWVHGLVGSVEVPVTFLNGSDEQIEFTIRTCSEWLDFTPRLKFRFTKKEDAAIRITFQTANGFSRVGTRALGVRDIGKPTMGLVLDSKDTNKYWRHVVLHEFGHAIGLKHEHHHPDSGIDWNVEEVFADLVNQDMNKGTIRRNIFRVLQKSYRCKGAPEFDGESVMIYPIKKKWTKHGFASKLRATLSDGDKRCALSIYST